MSRAIYMRDWRAKRAVKLGEGGLLPFQAAFAAAVCRENRPPEIAALSVPRGNGKSLALREVGGAVDHSRRSAPRAGG